MCILFILKFIPPHVYSTQPFLTSSHPIFSRHPSLLSSIKSVVSTPSYLFLVTQYLEGLWIIFYSSVITSKQSFLLPSKFIVRYTAHRDHLKIYYFSNSESLQINWVWSSLCSNNLSRLIRNITYKPKIFKDSWNLFFKLCVWKFIRRAEEAIKKSEDL